ncbi:MAG: thioesterase family protein [Luminiphilus sp.]|nr:thioesterase family protein [Luminiphilus sp.]
MTILDWDYPDPHTCSVTVTPKDIDALSHTNNGVYVSWCEQAAWSHTRALGLGEDHYQSLNRAMALTHAEYHYLRATYESDDLQVGTWITRWDRRLTMERQFQIIDSNTGKTVLRAKHQFVCIEISTGKPRRPPKEFIDHYGPAVLNLENP